MKVYGIIFLNKSRDIIHSLSNHYLVEWKTAKWNLGDRNAHILSFRDLRIHKQYSLLYKYMACNDCANVFMHMLTQNDLF